VLGISRSDLTIQKGFKNSRKLIRVEMEKISFEDVVKTLYIK